MNINSIKEILMNKRISQRDFAAKIGMTQSGLSQAFANGDFKISTLEKIAEALEVPVSYFFGNETETNTKGCEEILLENENLKIKNQLLESERLHLINDLAIEKYFRFILVCIARVTERIIENPSLKEEYDVIIYKETQKVDMYMKHLEENISKNENLTDNIKKDVYKRAVDFYNKYNSKAVDFYLGEIQWEIFKRSPKFVKKDTK